jgi:serine protease Do
LKTLTAMQDGMVAAVAKAEPSVVAIARVDEATGADGASGLNPRLDPDSADFLPDHFGTGVVIDKRGLILTAAHVVNPKSQHWVTTTAKKRYRARIKALDPRSDLAVLEIDARDLTPITLGDASQLKKGQCAMVRRAPHSASSPTSAAASRSSHRRRAAGATSSTTTRC